MDAVSGLVEETFTKNDTLPLCNSRPMGPSKRVLSLDIQWFASALFPSGIPELNGLLKGGYPPKSAILVVGPPGKGKELLGYSFILSGLGKDVCVYATRFASSEIISDMEAHGLNLSGMAPLWISSEEEKQRYTPEDLAGISLKIKGALGHDPGRGNRVVFDSLSPLLIYHSTESVYRFLVQLIAEVKRHDGCFLALLDSEMHPASVRASMEDLFDGVIHIESEEGDKMLVKLVKLRGADVRTDSKILLERGAAIGKMGYEQRDESGSKTILEEQKIQFCTSDDGIHIAYATTGKGPPVVKAANWLGHLQFDSQGIWSHWVAELSRYNTLVRFDQRGCGLSDRKIDDFGFERCVEDLESVVDSLGLEHFDLLGMSHGGSVSVAYAVRHPERVGHLILYGAFARGWAKVGLPAERLEEMEAVVKLVRSGWGRDSPAFRQIFTSWFMPEATADQMRGFNEYQKVSASPENAERLYRLIGNTDVSDLLPKVRVPTIVFHARGDKLVPFRNGLELASSIHGSRFVPLESQNHVLLEYEPAWKEFLSEYRHFLEVR